MAKRESDRPAGTDRPAQRTADGERTAVDCAPRPLRHGEVVKLTKPDGSVAYAVVDRNAYLGPAVTMPGEDAILYLTLVDRAARLHVGPGHQFPEYDHRETVSVGDSA